MSNLVSKKIKKIKNIFFLYNIPKIKKKKKDHPNIIKLYETFEDEKHIYLVMELTNLYYKNHIFYI